VDLFEGCEGKIAGTQSGLEAAAVFEDVFAGVPINETEIQDFFDIFRSECGTVRKRANASWAGAEAVDEPG